MAYTITDDVDTTNLGRIQRDFVQGGANPLPISLPESDSDEALLIPTAGANTRISVEGIKTGTLSELQTFVAKLLKWKNDGGKLSVSNHTYNSDLNGSFSIRVASISHSWDAGNPNQINYSLELVEGTLDDE